MIVSFAISLFLTTKTLMKVTQEKLPASQIGLEIEIASDVSKKAYEQVIQEFSRSANIPGFRKGKVPRQVLIQRLGATRLKASALENLLDSSLKEAIEQEKISVLGNWQLLSSFEDLVEKFEPGAPFTFSASVDVEPEVILKQYTGMQVQAEEVKFDPQRVDDVLQYYREQRATLIPVEGRPAQLNDVAIIDYNAALANPEDPEAEPEAFPGGGEAQDFQVELEDGRFVPGFVEGIVGMTPEEIKEILVTFPQDYSQATLAGRTARFTITLKELKEKELPELDDEFAEDVSEFKTLVELRESLETRFKDEVEEKNKTNKEQAILNELLNQVEMEVPETLIERQVTTMLNQMALQLQSQGYDVKKMLTQETIPALKQQSRPEAITQIKRVLALNEIAKREEMEVSAEEVETQSQEVLETLEDAGSIDPARLQEVVKEDLLREKVLGWLVEHTNIELVPEGSLEQQADLNHPDSSDEATDSDTVDTATAVDATDGDAGEADTE
jgi:trigger factor